MIAEKNNQMKMRRREEKRVMEEEKERQQLSDTVPSLSWSCRPEPYGGDRAEWWRTAAPGWAPADPWSPWQPPLC